MGGLLLRGSCLCGAATYDVADAFEYCLICHCSMCRRATGSAFKPFAGIKAHLIEVRGDILRHGEDVADGDSSAHSKSSGDSKFSGHSKSSGHDGRCADCGSLLYSLVGDGAYVHVTLGTLLDDPSIRPTAHIFVESKASWDVICDGLPQFDRLPSDRQAP